MQRGRAAARCRRPLQRQAEEAGSPALVAARGEKLALANARLQISLVEPEPRVERGLRARIVATGKACFGGREPG